MVASVVLSTGAGMGFQLVDAADTQLHNPVVEMNTCDSVYFGNYWQEEPMEMVWQTGMMHIYQGIFINTYVYWC